MSSGWMGWTVSAVGLAVFGLLAWQVRTEDSPVWRFDRDRTLQAKQHADQHPEIVDFARRATSYGAYPVMTAIAVIGAILLCINAQPRLAAIWLLAAMVGVPLNSQAKDWIERPRPDPAIRDQSVYENSPAFPSGHAMGSTIGYAALAYVGCVQLRRRWAQILLVALATAVIVTICWTRVYLRAHWCSDVIGGAALGLSCLSVCISLIGTKRA